MKKKILIVGGVAGGATCAARLRRLSEQDEIIILERGDHISFANCGLPYYIGSVIKDRQRLLLQTPESFHKRYNVDVRIRSEVTKIDRAAKAVTIKDLSSNREYTEGYDYLLLSPGAQPIKPPLPGINDQRIFTLRNIPDTDIIKRHIDESHPKTALVIGGGFIGIEMAENLHALGIQVTLVERMDQVMPPIDRDIANALAIHIRDKGVELILGASLKEFNGEEDLIAILDDGRKISCDMAILSIGVRPDTKFLTDSGIELEQNGAIRVNDQMRTNDPSIFAVGDAVTTNNPISDNPWWIALATPANRQARLVADIINGIDAHYPGTIGTSVVKVFDLTVASTGCSEKYLKANGIKYEKSFTHSANHAGYYPGATPVTTKLIFDPASGKILGAQIIGQNGVDKRIDVIATAVRCNAKAGDLKNLELSYAPPYGSAKDPVNIAGYVADNILNRTVEICHWHDIEDRLKKGAFLLDVRTKLEFEGGSIDGAKNIPIDELRSRLNEIPTGETVIAYCAVGLRGYLACRILTQSGYKTLNLSGGYTTYYQATAE